MFVASPHLVVTLKSELIHTTDLSSVKEFMAGGSKPAREILIAMKEFLPCGDVSVSYGMTEVGGLAAVHYPYSGRDSVGKLCGKIQMKIIDEDGNKLGPREPGEIGIKCAFKCLGYYANEEATMATIDENGFLWSGDIGYFDEDGYLYLVDRKKDMFKYCGYQISPTELENFLNQYPSIKTACVVGISDPIVGDLPAAVVIKREGFEISEQEIIDSVASKYLFYT